MSVDGRSIVLFREERTDDPYRQAFEKAGYDVRFIPVLLFRPIQEDALNAALAHPEAFSGLVLTSERAVNRVLDRPTESLVAWQTRPVYAVGPRTGEVLRAHGFSLRVPPEPTGARLAASILAAHADQRPLLFPCSTQRREELPALLEEARVALEALPVYDPVPVPALKLAPEPAPGWIACFSPSGVAVIADEVRNVWNDAHRAAIGETTARALNDVRLPAQAVAATPDATGLLEAIRRATV